MRIYLLFVIFRSKIGFTNDRRRTDMTVGADLSFVHLGISVQHMVKSFSVFGVSFAYYGLIIGIGMVAGLIVASADAKSK